MIFAGKRFCDVTKFSDLFAVSLQLCFHAAVLKVSDSQRSPTVVHFYFGTIQFLPKRKFAVLVRRKFRQCERDPDDSEQADASVNPELKFR